MIICLAKFKIIGKQISAAEKGKTANLGKTSNLYQHDEKGGLLRLIYANCLILSQTTAFADMKECADCVTPCCPQ